MILAHERISPGLQLAQPQSAAVVAGDHLFDPQIVRLKFLSRRVLVPDDQHGALTRRHDDLRWREDMILDGDVYADRLRRRGWVGVHHCDSGHEHRAADRPFYALHQPAFALPGYWNVQSTVIGFHQPGTP